MKLPIMSIREAYGRALAELGERYENLVVLDADTSKATQSFFFRQRFPDRFFNVGIAEANMVSIAAGLASAGKIPIVNTFSFLLTMRAGEQVRTMVAYPRLNVKLAAAHTGFSACYDGPTHQDFMDIAIMRAMPNVTVISFSDTHQVTRGLDALVQTPGPVYFRLHRNAFPSVSEGTPFELGKAVRHRSGGEVTLIATGPMVCKCLEAAEILGGEGIQVGVIEIHTIKPIDVEAIIDAAKTSGAIVTVEEHSIYGGLGGAVAEVLSQYHPTPMERVGVPDVFAESGDYEELLEKYGLSVQGIIKKVRTVISRFHL